VKITDVKTDIIDMPFGLKDVPVPARTTRLVTIVRVSTDEGITGIGESFSLFEGAAATVAKFIETMIKPRVLGKDPSGVAALWEDLFHAFYPIGRGGLSISAMSGFEQALWDIKGKALKVPAYQLLGGPAHERIRGYASLAHYATPRDVALAAEKSVKMGFTAIKLHESDVASVAAARKAVGDGIDIMLDVNCHWDRVNAIRMGRQFEPYNLYWFEEPVSPGDDYEGLARVRETVKIPIAAGENEYTARSFTNFIEKKAVDYLQPSMFRIGGILQHKKVFALGNAFNCSVVPHSWAIGPSMAATLQVSFSEPAAFLIETAIDTTEASIFVDPLPLEKGFWKRPQGPGLGIELDEKVIRKYKVG
jgi:L-alanine-DL-glutamate epimerase-like enolase superfamily enzyme